MTPLWLRTPGALPVPLLAHRRSQGCAIPVPRDAGACGPAGIQHPPCLPPGTWRVLEKGKKKMC